MCMYTYIYIYIPMSPQTGTSMHMWFYGQNDNWGKLPVFLKSHTGCLKLQVIFRKRAIDYYALLRKLTFKDKASYRSLPLCTWIQSAYVTEFTVQRRIGGMYVAVCCSVLQCVAVCCSVPTPRSCHSVRSTFCIAQELSPLQERLILCSTGIVHSTRTVGFSLCRN